MFCRRAILVSSVLWSGCFVELGGGYYPSVHQTSTDSAGMVTRTSQGAWAASIKVGFFFDVVFEKWGLGLGWAPKGADLVLAKDPQRAHGGDGHMFRGDFVLPPNLLGTDVVRPRVVGEFDYYTDATYRRPGESGYVGHGGSGHRFFLGMGLSHTSEFGSQIISLGLDRNALHTSAYMPADTGDGQMIDDPDVETAAWGAKGSVTIVLIPQVGHKHSADPESPPSSSPTPPAHSDNAQSPETTCPWGHYGDVCDAGNHCHTEWICP